MRTRLLDAAGGLDWPDTSMVVSYADDDEAAAARRGINTRQSSHYSPLSRLRSLRGIARGVTSNSLSEISTIPSKSSFVRGGGGDDRRMGGDELGSRLPFFLAAAAASTEATVDILGRALALAARRGVVRVGERTGDALLAATAAAVAAASLRDDSARPRKKLGRIVDWR